MRQEIKIEDSDSETRISFGRPGFSLFDKASSTDSGYSNKPHFHIITDSSCSDISDLLDSNESDDQWFSFPEMHFSMPPVEKWNVEKKANNQKKIKSKKQKERQLKRKIIRTEHSAISFTDQLLEASTLEAKQMFTENSYRIIIVGTVGSGKSSLGNSLLGCQHFKTGISGSSVTRKCEKGETFKHGKNITVVDTIGYTSEVLKKSKLLRAFDKISPGPHAVLNVIPFSERFTSELFSSIQQFVNLVGKEVYNYLVIVLTHEDQLEMENLTIDEFIKSSPTEFKELLNQCENRIFAINNRATDGTKHKKVKRLIKIIEKIKRKNACFETYDEFLF
ncbi:GTPase IMAP family member 4-like [Saccostrea cucullata]|uniref:GTPase IMAP family member 4-like n=1 Tax=Saccostrea cuccullata TaxID=36930 RepID=UPI002ED2A1FD